MQNSPSLQLLPAGSSPLHASAASSHTSEQSLSPSGPLHGSLPPWHEPEPSQVSPVVQNCPSSHAVPESAGAKSQAWSTHTAIWHSGAAGHCESSLHSTHVPAPSHTPPAHAVSIGRSSCEPMPPLQTSSVHSLPSSTGRSSSSATGAGKPLPLHSTCRQSLSVWSAAGSTVPSAVSSFPQVPSSQMIVRQNVSITPQSAASLQPTQPPVSLHTPAAHGVPGGTGVWLATPSAQASVVHSKPSSGTSVSSICELTPPEPSHTST